MSFPLEILDLIRQSFIQVTESIISHYIMTGNSMAALSTTNTMNRLILNHADLLVKFLIVALKIINLLF